MDTATKIVSSIHGAFVIIIFFILLGTAALSLFALSPISIEEYMAYKEQLSAYNSLNDQNQNYLTGQVAGQFTSISNEAINSLYYVDLGREQTFNYKLLAQSNQLDYNLSLTPEFRAANPKLPLLELHNVTDKLETYLLMLTNSSADSYLAGITTDVSSRLNQVGNVSSDITYVNDIAKPLETRTYEFTLLPDQKSTLILISEQLTKINPESSLLTRFSITRINSSEIIPVPTNLNLNSLP